MDNIERTIGSSSFISEPMNIIKFLSECQAELSFLSGHAASAISEQMDIQKKIRQTMAVNNDMMASLQLDCGETALDNGEPELETLNWKSAERLLEKVPDNVTLETLKLQKKDVEMRMKEEAYRTATRTEWRKQTKVDSNVISPNIFDGNERPMSQVLLIVQIYRPQKNLSTKFRATTILEQELAVLGSQKLTALKDKIICIADETSPYDISSNPKLAIKAKDVYRSGFFYFNGVFYNDMRFPDNKEYSQVIMDWSKTVNDGPFQTALMEQTNFEELEIKLGYPYLYQHQGNCEHTIIFTDIRLNLRATNG